VSLLMLPWRPLPIATLTIRQFLAGRAVLVVLLIAQIPALLGLIYLINSEWTTPHRFLVEPVFLELFTPTLLPIMVLILATSAFGNELEDRTLPFLTLKPIARSRIVAEKFIGVILVSLPIIFIGLVFTWALVEGATGPRRLLGRGLDQPDLAPVLGAMLAATSVGIVAFAAIFLSLSLFVSRALLAGMVYAFAWESLLGRFLPGIRIISVRHYVQSVFVRLLDDPSVTIGGTFTLRAALVTMATTVVVALILGTWRLRRLNLE
jgi:ABC-2 type transport system permease protein